MCQTSLCACPGTLGQIEAPSELTLNSFNDTLVPVKMATMDQTEDKSKEKLEKKDKWGKVLAHHKRMMPNLGSPDGKVQAVAPTKETLDVTKKESIVEAQDHCISLIKR